jgi:protein-disulfide isomerase
MKTKLAYGLSAMVLAFGLGGSVAMAQETTTTTAPAPAATEIKDFSIGAPDAKVTIIEYAMFTCPHCKTFHDSNWPQLKAEYIDTGKVRFEFREVYFNRPALWAAMVARCGGEMRYFGMVDMLFDKQEEWAASEDPKAIVDNLKTLGRAAGMEDAAMDVCLQDMTTAQALVAHDEAARTKDGVEGTPTFFINGVKYSNMEYADLKAILDAELAK